MLAAAVLSRQARYRFEAAQVQRWQVHCRVLGARVSGAGFEAAWAAQGFADAEVYQADVEETFVNKKFEQLKSTIQLLSENGLGRMHFRRRDGLRSPGRRTQCGSTGHRVR